MLFCYSERIIAEAQYLCENNSTIRKTAERFGVSKSCVHKDLTSKLKSLNPALYLAVKEVLKKNFEQKHLRGGIATKRLWENKNKRP